MRIHLRTVNRFVTAGRPTGSLRQAARVIGIANENSAGRGLLLKVALQTKRLIPLR